MVTEDDAVTALVATVKVALVAPAATVTLDGVLATVVLRPQRSTVAPSAAVAGSNVTVPVDEFPPVTLVGLRVSEERETVAGAEADASNSRTAGLGSVCEIATNFDGEII